MPPAKTKVTKRRASNIESIARNITASAVTSEKPKSSKPSRRSSNNPTKAERPSESAEELKMANALIYLYASVLDDIEKVRIAQQLRIGAMQREGVIVLPDTAQLSVDALTKLEHEAVKNLEKAMKNHPLGEWCDRTIGVGRKQLARLLNSIGDPAWNNAEDRLRHGHRELWAYCGYDVRDGLAPKHKKGVQANWSSSSRMRAFLIAESCIKNRRSPYRAVYDEGRKKYEGLDITDGHKHNRAMRLVAKAMLKDLYLESRKLHEPVD